jgi:hypothetical protein
MTTAWEVCEGGTRWWVVARDAAEAVRLVLAERPADADDPVDAVTALDAAACALAGDGDAWTLAEEIARRPEPHVVWSEG